MISELREALVRVQLRLRDAILNRCRELSADQLASVASTSGGGDVTFTIDVAAEELLVAALEEEIGSLGTSLVVLFEGQQGEPIVVPKEISPQRAEFRSIWDPLDGSRMLAYQLHSGWVLCSAAPNRGNQTRLADAVIAVQTEVPTLNQRDMAILSVIKGQPLQAELEEIDSGLPRPLSLRPSQATTIENGFIANECYFEGPAALLAEIEEEIIYRALGDGQPGQARVWRDTQLSSAGTLYNLLSGKLRFAHDFRPLMRRSLAEQGRALSLCAHPYDLCTAPLLCGAVGVVLTDPWGEPFDAPMAIEHDVAWAAYANRELAAALAPIVRDVLRSGT